MILYQRHKLDTLEMDDLSNVCLDMKEYKKQLRLFFWAVSISSVQTCVQGILCYLGIVTLYSVYVSISVLGVLLVSYLIYRKYKLLRNIVERVAVRYLNNPY